MPRSEKWLLWIASWVVVILVMGRETMPGVLFFPLGLLLVFPSSGETVMTWAMYGMFYGPIGWSFYAVLSLAMGAARTKKKFFLLYLLFCALLIVNIAGCKRAMGLMEGIH